MQILQRQRRRSGELLTLADASRREQLVVMLRLLDAESAGADSVGYRNVSLEWRAMLDQAYALRDGGYRRLSGLPA